MSAKVLTETRMWKTQAWRKCTDYDYSPAYISMVCETGIRIILCNIYEIQEFDEDGNCVCIRDEVEPIVADDLEDLNE